ncbi:MAG: PQQ-binding-like beta-propeller repeat protein [Phycisphaerae bacterium]|nr:PQQ-binding-like beta-propeller repeat protein [Phycisphaerae bacterium]
MLLLTGLLPAPHAAAMDMEIVEGPSAPVDGRDFQVLVTTEEDWPDFFAQAAEMIEAGNHERAIRILQALAEREQSGFVARGERRYVGLAVRAREILSTLPPAGRALYRGLYDGQAGHLYRTAVATGRLAPLHRIVHQYARSSYGPKALDRLGLMYFDRGRFAAAARCWGALLQQESSAVPPPLLLARAATAYHLSGRRDLADTSLARLRERYPSARARIAGEDVRLVDYVERMRRIPAAVRRRVLAGWPGLGGVPDGQGVMTAADEVVLTPMWLRPSDARRAGVTGLIAGGADRMPGSYKGRTKVQGGLVTAYGQDRSSRVLLPLVHPLVVGETVLYRTDDGVVARDLFSGQPRWERTERDLRLYRSPSQTQMLYLRRGHPGRRPGVRVGDEGYYHLTAGSKLVFVRCGVTPLVMVPQHMYGRWRASAAAKSSAQSGTLVALRVNDGRRAWVLGDGASDDDVLSAGRFVSPVTYHRGRLYLVMLHADQHHVVCLDAQRGTLLWRQPVSQTPALPPNRGGHANGGTLFERVSPPAVAAGRVVVCTNAGVLAALDAATGKPLWANHYPSTTNRPMNQRRGTSSAVRCPSNPLLVSGDRVICLPADSDQVLAVSVDDGRSRWSCPRGGLANLSGVDAQTVLLSEPGLVLLSSTDGERLWEWDGGVSVCGRPAVTSGRVLASTSGELLTLNLKTRKVTRRKLGAADALLGNLVSCERALLAANGAGVCAYFSFDDVRSDLAERIRAAVPAERLGLMLRQGQVAFNAGRFDLAAKDFAAARRLAERLRRPVDAGRAQSWAYRTQIALANRAADPIAMIAGFTQALDLAVTDREHAHTLLRLVKAHERADDLTAAVACADDLRDAYADVEIVDVAIGADALDTDRMGPDRPMLVAEIRVRRLLRRLIEQNGRDVYAAVERRAGEGLVDARQDGRPETLLGVRDRWPNSRAADRAVFAAAEAHYRRARDAEDAAAREHMDAARRLLAELSRAEVPALRLQAATVLAMLYQRDGQVHVAADRARAVLDDPDFDASLTVDFADISARAEALLRALLDGSGGDAAHDAALRPPLTKAWTLDGRVVVLRDARERPVRVGGRVALVDGKRLVLLGGASDVPTETIGTDSPLTGDFICRQRPFPWGRGGTVGVARDGDILVLAAANGVSGYDIAAGKPCWHRKVADLEWSASAAQAVCAGVVLLADASGRLHALDATTGRPRQWTAQHFGARRAPMGIQAAAGIAVVTYGAENKPPQHAVTVCAFDLSTGKLLARWRSENLGWAHLAPNGLLAVMIDGRLSVYAVGGAADFHEPAWTRDVEGTGELLDAVDERIVVRMRHGVEVLSLAGGGIADTVIKTNAGDGPVTKCCLFDDAVYVARGKPSAPAKRGDEPPRRAEAADTPRGVIATADHQGRARRLAAFGPRHRGGVAAAPHRLRREAVGMTATPASLPRATVKAEVLEKWPLPTGLCAWKMAVSPGDVVSDVGAGGGAAVVSLRSGGVQVLDARTGDVLQRVKPDNRGASHSAPVIAGRRLIVETRDGVSIYASEPSD